MSDDDKEHMRSVSADRYETVLPKEVRREIGKGFQKTERPWKDGWKWVLAIAVGIWVLHDVVHSPATIQQASVVSAPTPAVTVAPVLPSPTPAAVRQVDPSFLVPVQRATLISYPLGWKGIIKMPDGSLMDVTAMGTVDGFHDLPKYPGWHDMYHVRNPYPGSTWVWAMAPGFSRMAWIDP